MLRPSTTLVMTLSAQVTAADKPWRGLYPSRSTSSLLSLSGKKNRHPGTPEPDFKPKINRRRPKYLKALQTGKPPSNRDSYPQPVATPAYSDGSGVDVLEPAADSALGTENTYPEGYGRPSLDRKRFSYLLFLPRNN